MPDPVLLTIGGDVETPLSLRFDDLRAFAESDHVRDVSQLLPTRCGDGVTLDALLERAKPRPGASYLTLHASRDDFYVSIPLAPVRAQCIVVYSLDDAPLPPDEGGPIRFLVRDPAACHTSELDDCANIKYLDRIELTASRGRDTRPTTAADHAALHASQDK